MTSITIIVTDNGTHADGYFAHVAGESEDYAYLGGSPDEAVGYLIRERLLNGGPLTIKEIRHDEPDEEKS